MAVRSPGSQQPGFTPRAWAAILVPAGEVRHPVALAVEMKALDRLFHTDLQRSAARAL